MPEADRLHRYLFSKTQSDAWIGLLQVPQELARSVPLRIWRRLVSITLALHQHDASQKAGAMAFDLFLGLLPLAAIAGWVLYHLAGSPEQGNSFLGGLINVAPGPAADLVRDQLRRLGEHGGTIAPLSIVGFIWIASAGAHTAMSSIQSARTGNTRAWLLNRAIAIGVVVILLLLVPSSAVAIVFSEAWLRHNISAGTIERSMAMLARVGTFLLSLSVATLGTAAFYAISTFRMEDRKNRTLFPGAFAFAFLWVLSSWGFSVYVTKIGRYSLFYGSLAAVALMLLWLWLSSFLLLVGSELNLQLDGTRETIMPSIRILRRRPPPHRPGQPAPEPKASVAEPALEQQPSRTPPS